MARILKSVAQTKAVIPNHARCHRVSPTDVVYRHAKSRRQSLTFVRAGSPAAHHDRLDSVGLQFRSIGDFFDRQTGFLKQQIHSADRQDDLPLGRPDS